LSGLSDEFIVDASIDTSARTGVATISDQAGETVCSIVDSNYADH
jgi:hypothetical protein